MIVYGFHPVREALGSDPGRVRRVLVAESRGGRRRSEIEGLAERHGVSVEVVPEARLEEVAAGVHNGFAAELAGASDPVRTIESPGIESSGDRTVDSRESMPDAPAPETSKSSHAGGDPDLVLLVEDVQDPRNLGALLRVCEGAGVGRVMVRDRGSAPISPTVVKTSAGAAEWLPVERVPNTDRTIQAAQKEGFWVYGAAEGGDPPWEIDLTGKVMLVIGGEEAGLRRLTGERCDRLVGLPMAGRVGSLNLATAAAAILYEAVRQRRG